MMSMNPGMETMNNKRSLNQVIIDGKKYYEQPITHKPFSNICRGCAFYGSACYDRTDFSCHSDSRPDGIDVFFIEVK